MQLEDSMHAAPSDSLTPDIVECRPSDEADGARQISTIVGAWGWESGAATMSSAMTHPRLGNHMRFGRVWPTGLCWCFLAVAFAGTANNSIAAPNDAQGKPGAAPANSSPSEPTHYIELQLDDRTRLSALKPGDGLTGHLSRDVYSGDREIFPSGTMVHLTVGKLERRKREPNDHWPGIVTLFTPRHENYPTFDSATVSSPEGKEIPLRVSLVSIINKSELHPTRKTPPGTKPPKAPRQKQPAPGQTVILETTSLTAQAIATLAPKQPRTGADTTPVQLETGTRAQVVLLRGLSASKSHPGDSFLARLVEPVRMGSRIVLPEGVLLQGNVLKATPPRWLSRPGTLTLAFTGLAMTEGGSSPISATVAGAELDSRSHTRLDSEGGLRGGPPGKAWMLINLGATAGIAKITDDTLQLIIEALVSTATDASTAGTTRIVAACTSGIFMVTRHGRDVVLPRMTEMDITFNRPLLLPQPTTSFGPQSPVSTDTTARPASQ